MSKRPLAALCALLAFMAVLVAVPLATSETAEAHTKTVKRCSYDPFTNVQQCWNENVAHTHSCGAGLTGTYPNCYPIPPDNDGDDGRNDDEREKEAERKRQEAEAKRKAEAERKRKEAEAEAERKRKEAEAEAERKRKAAEAEAERIRKAAEAEAERKRKEAEAEAERKRKAAEEAAKKECPSGEHRHGSGGCGPDHEPPCGVGTWDPGHGHASVDRPACTYADASHATGPITYCGTQSHTHKTRHFHYGGNGCHPVADAHTTDTNSDTCSDWVDALIAAINTNSSPLPARPADCKSMTTAEIAGVVRTVTARFGSAIGDALKKVLEYQGDAAEGERGAYAELGEEIEKLWDKTPEGAKRFIRGAAAGAACVGLVKVIAATSAATGGAAAPAWIAWLAAHPGTVAVTCAGAVEYAVYVVENWGKDDDSDDDSGDGSDDSDGTDGSDDDSGEDSDDDSGDDDSDEPDTTEQPKITRADLDKAIADYRAGLITAEEMRKIANGWSCQQYGGHYCRYAQ